MTAEGGRPVSLRTRLVRAGLTDTTRASTLLTDRALVELLRPAPGSGGGHEEGAAPPVGVDEDVAPGGGHDGASPDGSGPGPGLLTEPGTAAGELVAALARVADPDEALLGLTRVAEAALAAGHGPAWRTALTTPGPARDRVLAVLGASTALVDHLVRHPADLDVLLEDDLWPDPADRAERLRAELLRSVGADPDAARPVADRPPVEGTDLLRRAYRRRLLAIAAADLTADHPTQVVDVVAAALADLAAAALESALALARADLPDHGAAARLAVLGLGKCGGRELNYVSDVDVIHVVEPADGHAEDEALAVGTRLATALARVCGGASAEPALWPVDAALRPEGKNGPLVRTVASHVAYYERWAQTWEFQALLKARPVAGDREVGEAYVAALAPMVWSAVEREHFVEDAQAMRRRVEQHVPPAEADRQIKLGAGGLRDVEFTVQLLQLVHGRADETIRSSTTLDALAALSAGGYVGRDHAARLAECYRLLRSLEHRVQLHRLRRTHLMPTAEADLRRLARAVRLEPAGPASLVEEWRTVRRDVRRLHEELFYRPLLPATAHLTREEASLAPEAARARLAAIGYRDPAGALRHIAALTEGVSRRAAIQRQLLPVLLGWFAEGADPDGGLLAFRHLSDTLGTTHWYLKLLRDSGAAAQRLAHLLSTSRYVADALSRSPESVAWLDDDADLVPRDRARLDVEVDALLSRSADTGSGATMLRALRRRELARTAASEVLGTTGAQDAAAARTAAADAALVGALRLAQAEAHAADGALTDVAVIAMGRLGGAEMGYGSDADVLFVHRARPGADEAAAQAQAVGLATRLRALLGEVGPEPALEIDADLRPEGRNGPLVRSLASYAEYYARWSSPWESQALLRARPVAGPEDLRTAFVELVDPLRYREGGADAATVREVRRLKARMEAERLPRGVEPTRHLKLGRGGLSDVEWTVQLLQLCHGAEVTGLRTPATLPALAAAEEAGLVDRADAQVLREAWVLGSRLRDALVLLTGRGGAAADVLPHDRRVLAGLARVLGMPPGSGTELEETYLRAGRRARAVVERVFYD